MSIMERMTEAERIRFMERTVDVDGCLVWTGALDKDGYGGFSFRGDTRRAHRVSYWSSVGDIPSGMIVDHICRNRACVRPEHLRILSRAENRRRSVTGLCKQGHPLNRTYGNQRYCLICQAAKSRRIRAKWKAEGRFEVPGLTG